MSAIWGAIDISGEKLAANINGRMKQAFDDCKIDRFEMIEAESVAMGCGIQYFTPEAYTECLPHVEDDIYFDADVVLDNREYLIEQIGISEAEGKKLADGQILFRLYNKFGKSCLNDILGAYTFVYYDKKSKKLDMICDAVGNRTLYYKIEDDVVYYSSLMESINLVSKSKRNDKWYLDFLAMDFVLAFADQETTPYDNIYRVPTASIVEISSTAVNIERYWNPLENLKKNKVKYKDDEEVAKKFKEIWKEAVRCVLRTEDETAILLSGGLDSTAVTSEAAPYLKAKGRKLYSYTAIPIEEYEAQKERFIDDETSDVLKTAEYFGNIETNFIDMKGVNSWNGLGKEMKILEMPYKSTINCLWIVEAAEKAYAHGARILLTGAYGNSCLSYTGIERYFNKLFMQGRWVTLWKEITAFHKIYNFRRKIALRVILKQCLGKKEVDEDIYCDSYVNRVYAKELGCEENLVNIFKEDAVRYVDDSGRWNIMIDWKGMRQIGEMEMKHSLYSGVLIRDPSIDKRLIEFCIQLPLNQFDREGVKRRLVNVYLKDQIPPHVIRARGQGRQSADMRRRLELVWNQVYKEMLAVYERNIDSVIVDVPKAIEDMRKKPRCMDYDNYDLNRHIYTIQALLTYEK